MNKLKSLKNKLFKRHIKSNTIKKRNPKCAICLKTFKSEDNIRYSEYNKIRKYHKSCELLRPPPFNPHYYIENRTLPYNPNFNTY